jgi:hypothetical protein
MEREGISFGPIRIRLPDGNQAGFSIFHDLAGVFGLEYQNEAAKALKSALKDVKPRANIDHESDYTHITSSNPTTVVEVVKAIQRLASPEQRASLHIDQDDLLKQLWFAKRNRPEPKKWEAGDVFSFALKDGTCAYGQVLRKSWCTCALLDKRSSEMSLSASEIRAARVVSLLHILGDQLNNGAWTVLYNHPLLADPDSGHGGRFPGIGSISYGGGGSLEELANAYWGLTPWNVKYKEDYFDGMLQPGITRPDHAIVLSQEDRRAYRLKHFGVE